MPDYVKFVKTRGEMPSTVTDVVGVKRFARGFRVLSKRSIFLYLSVCVFVTAVHIILNVRHVDVKDLTQEDVKPLLVLSTTLTDSPSKRHINCNTLSLWSQLRPAVQPVLYVEADDPCCANIDPRWSKQDIPERGGVGLPVLRSMILHSMDLFDADFYGYGNGDILFGSDLIITLNAIKAQLPKFNKPLIIGRRTNAPVDKRIASVDDVARIANEKGELFHAGAEDYFITTKHGFDWHGIPQFVIGRRGYDNWIVAYARRNNHTVIDVTNTVVALHQTGKDGNWAGHRKSDRNINMRISGPFKYRKGFLLCVTYQTDFDMNGKVWVRKRTIDSPYC